MCFLLERLPLPLVALDGLRYFIVALSELAQLANLACVHGSTNGTNGIPISFKALPMVPLVIQLIAMVPLVKTVGSQYCRQSTVWAKLPTFESRMIQYGVLNFEFINFTNKHCFYQDDISK